MASSDFGIGSPPLGKRIGCRPALVNDQETVTVVYTSASHNHPPKPYGQATIPFLTFQLNKKIERTFSTAGMHLKLWRVDG